MQNSHTLRDRRPHGYALAEILAGLVAAAGRTLARWRDQAGQARKRARARRDLHRLSDHALRDIGLHRSQIDRLFG